MDYGQATGTARLVKIEKPSIGHTHKSYPKIKGEKKQKNGNVSLIFYFIFEIETFHYQNIQY